MSCCLVFSPFFCTLFFPLSPLSRSPPPQKPQKSSFLARQSQTFDFSLGFPSSPSWGTTPEIGGNKRVVSMGREKRAAKMKNFLLHPRFYFSLPRSLSRFSIKDRFPNHWRDSTLPVSWTIDAFLPAFFRCLLPPRDSYVVCAKLS